MRIVAGPRADHRSRFHGTRTVASRCGLTRSIPLAAATRDRGAQFSSPDAFGGVTRASERHRANSRKKARPRLLARLLMSVRDARVLLFFCALLAREI